jgi:2-phosphosulfolactate phosphatase
MRVDVAFSPAGLSHAAVHRRTVFVIDILRATTTMCAAMTNGAKAIIPVSSTEEALRLAHTIGSKDVLLSGERNCVRIPGFHLGNSPVEMKEDVVRGKTLILTTSNGTNALLACQGAGSIFPAAAVNLTPAAERGREALEANQPVLIVCAGRNAAFALDDAYCAGRLAAALLGGTKPRKGLNDAALASIALVRRYGEDWERPLRSSRSGRELLKLGFAEDIHAASRLDAYPVSLQFHERRVTLSPAPLAELRPSPDRREGVEQT